MPDQYKPVNSENLNNSRLWNKFMVLATSLGLALSGQQVTHAETNQPPLKLSDVKIGTMGHLPSEHFHDDGKDLAQGIAGDPKGDDQNQKDQITTQREFTTAIDNAFAEANRLKRQRELESDPPVLNNRVTPSTSAPERPQIPEKEQFKVIVEPGTKMTNQQTLEILQQFADSNGKNLDLSTPNTALIVEIVGSGADSHLNITIPENSPIYVEAMAARRLATAVNDSGSHSRIELAKRINADGSFSIFPVMRLQKDALFGTKKFPAGTVMYGFKAEENGNVSIRGYLSMAVISNTSITQQDIEGRVSAQAFDQGFQSAAAGTLREMNQLQLADDINNLPAEGFVIGDIATDTAGKKKLVGLLGVNQTNGQQSPLALVDIDPETGDAVIPQNTPEFSGVQPVSYAENVDAAASAHEALYKSDKEYHDDFDKLPSDEYKLKVTTGKMKHLGKGGWQETVVNANGEKTEREFWQGITKNPENSWVTEEARLESDGITTRIFFNKDATATKAGRQFDTLSKVDKLDENFQKIVELMRKRGFKGKATLDVVVLPEGDNIPEKNVITRNRLSKVEISYDFKEIAPGKFVVFIYVDGQGAEGNFTVFIFKAWGEITKIDPGLFLNIIASTNPNGETFIFQKNQ